MTLLCKRPARSGAVHRPQQLSTGLYAKFAVNGGAQMSAGAVVMSYVLCPNPECGDPVGGRIPQPPEELKLTCPRCRRTFAFEQDELCRGIVSYDRESDRWKVESFMAH